MYSCPDIPLVDLHRHMDGSVRVETILDLAKQHNLDLPAYDLESLRPHVVITEKLDSLEASFPKFALMQKVLVDYDACRRITIENLEDAISEGIDYIELRFSPFFMGEIHDLDVMGVTSAVCEAWEEARDRLPVKSKLILIMSRTYGPESCEVELQAAIAHRDRGVVAVDLAGVESMGRGTVYVDHCRRAREAGLHLTIHAGEWSGAQSVRQAVLELEAERIGHAIGAADDPATMDLLGERGVGIESCPTSNVQFKMIPTFKDHPLPMWLDRGLLVSINTDDPGISGIDLPHEYRMVREEIGLTDDQVRQAQANGVKTAFLTDEERQALWAAKA